jgi:hypothetical protein
MPIPVVWRLILIDEDIGTGRLESAGARDHSEFKRGSDY